MKRFKSSKKLLAPKSEHTSYKSWSADRPNKSLLEDDLAEQMFGLLEQQQWSLWAGADATGLSTSTIAHYKGRTTKRPQALSLQMLAKALGGKIVFVKEARSRK